MRKLVILLITFIVLFVSCVYSTPLPYNDKIFDMTIGEAKKLSPNNNPLDILIEYKEKYGEDVFDNYYYIPIEPGEYEGIDLYVGDANYDINEEIKNGIDTIIKNMK